MHYVAGPLPLPVSQSHPTATATAFVKSVEQQQTEGERQAGEKGRAKRGERGEGSEASEARPGANRRCLSMQDLFHYNYDPHQKYLTQAVCRAERRG